MLKRAMARQTPIGFKKREERKKLVKVVEDGPLDSQVVLATKSASTLGVFSYPFFEFLLFTLNPLLHGIVIITIRKSSQHSDMLQPYGERLGESATTRRCSLKMEVGRKV